MRSKASGNLGIDHCADCGGACVHHNSPATVANRIDDFEEHRRAFAGHGFHTDEPKQAAVSLGRESSSQQQPDLGADNDLGGGKRRQCREDEENRKESTHFAQNNVSERKA